MKRLALIAVFVSAQVGGACSQDLRWATAYNARYGSTFDFPSGVFTDFDPPRDGRGGMLWRTRDGNAELYLVGVSISNMVEPELALKDRVANAEGIVDYARATPEFYVISRINRGTVHYTRCNYPQGRNVVCFEISYPQVESKWWDPIVTRISRSLAWRAG